MSHFEWAQNRGGVSWTAAEASSRLDTRMQAAAASMLEVAQTWNVSLVVAAQLLAVKRLSAALSN